MTPKKMYTEEEMKFRTELSSKLVSIEGKIDLLHAQIAPVLTLAETVTAHDRQINRWIGINSVLGGALAIALSVLASLYAKFRHWM